MFSMSFINFCYFCFIIVPSYASQIPRSVKQAHSVELCKRWLCTPLSIFILTSKSDAAIADENDTALKDFLDAPDGNVISKREATANFMNQIQRERPLCSDEFVVSFKSSAPLGLGLEEKSYQGFPVTVVRNIKDADLVVQHPELRDGAILSSINKEPVDGVALKKIAEIITAAKENGDTVDVKFRDPSRYFELLDSTVGKPLKLVATSYLPANARDAGAAEQLIYVERLELPPPEARVRSSQLLDVMEIQYVAQLAASIPGEETRIVDSSAERAPPGTSAQSIYYVLGQQNGPPGFPPPPGWDLTLRGMVVGEKRRITLPYTLAYERKGDKNRKIPPFATLIYTVKLVSLT